jgi:hypothetical protein
MLKLSRPAAEVFIPDGTSWEAASTRVTHLVVAAHADDVEIMAWHAVLHAEGLAAVIVTKHGRRSQLGSPRPSYDRETFYFRAEPGAHLISRLESTPGSLAGGLAP